MPGEASWELAGAEKPAALIAFEARSAEAGLAASEAVGRRKPKRGKAGARSRRSGAD